ncbi:GNAT family N-acetyltransferase [Mobilitalea sibirica]|uniref:GNAT family N-acetyltransferase n=1 Tax=Mobilitalea sibirica TaxID=1462919 RepID=A0A8J7KT48_9FIRM|nr:GNAT family N-acetyltransferase [Mobilitalea sibirica]MBH1940986.1 GNAT family N-acetyltransferase [Mobilitalea sibirica]
MIYYKDEKIIIRDMKEEDAGSIYEELTTQDCHPDLKTYQNYYIEQEKREKYVFIAEYEGNIAGYVTLIPNVLTGPFANQNIPEVNNLGVFIKYQKKGIGNKLLDVLEEVAANISDEISLAVGVHSGYGQAQRIYIKRGYLFDGSGVWYQGKQLEQYADCCNDDDLILYLSKKLNG